MQKLLLISVLIATMVVPIMASADPSPRRGLKKTVRRMIWFAFFYFIGLLYIYPRI